eukprot:m.340695 g.340695  ORF g.340695 m.340695 type:complete len:216 (+) comp19462_c0_seq1:199-846(+)
MDILQLLKREPPTTDVEICCRFEDVATEGHAHYAKKNFLEAKEHYQALLSLAGQLTRPSPLMKSTSHFFLSMACGGLAEEELAKGNMESCDKFSREADANHALAVRSLDYNGDVCPLKMLDKQLLMDYESFSRKQRIDTLLLQGKYRQKQGNAAVSKNTSSTDQESDKGKEVASPVVAPGNTDNDNDEHLPSTKPKNKKKKKKKKPETSGNENPT